MTVCRLNTQRAPCGLEALGDPFCLSRSPEYGAAPTGVLMGRGQAQGKLPPPPPTPGLLWMTSVRHGCPSSLLGAGAGTPQPQPLRGPSPTLRGGRPASHVCMRVQGCAGAGVGLTSPVGKDTSLGCPLPAIQPWPSLLSRARLDSTPSFLSSPRSRVLLGQETHAGS